MIGELDEVQIEADSVQRRDRIKTLTWHLILIVLYSLGGVALYSTIILFGGYPPSREVLGEENYYVAWRNILIAGVMQGILTYAICWVWFPRLTRRYPPPSEPIIQFDLRTMFIVIAVASLLFWVVWYIQDRKLDEVVVLKLDVINVSASFSFD